MVSAISKTPFDSRFWYGFPTASITGTPSTFYNIQVNEYGEIGTALSRSSSQPIDDTRSDRVGAISYKSSSAQITTEFKQYNVQRLIAAALFANLAYNASTNPIDGSTPRPITGMSTSGFSASGGGLTGQAIAKDNFRVDDLIQISGAPTPSNNVKTRITALTSDTGITVNSTLVNDSVTSGQVTLEVVGHQWPSGNLSLTYASGVLTLTNGQTISSTNLGFDVLGFERGQWVFIGGDGSTENFGTSNQGFARIKTISAASLVFDQSTWTPTTSSGSGKGIRLWYGNFVKNRTGSGIVKQYMALLLKLGTDDNGSMSKLILGSVVKGQKIKFPKPAEDSNITVETSWDATSSQDRTGTDGLPSSTYIAAEDDQMYCTSAADLKSFKLYKRSTTTTNPSTTNAYIITSDIDIKNNTETLPALGYDEGYDVKYGALEVTGTATVAFLRNEQIKDINSDSKFGIYGRWGRNYNGVNQGFIMDMPFLDLKTKGVTPKKKDDLMLDIDFKAVRDEALNKVISFDFFNGLPDVAIS